MKSPSVCKADLTIKTARKETADATVAFFNVYRERSKPPGTLPVFHVQDRHNHVRSVMSFSDPGLPLSVLMPLTATSYPLELKILHKRNDYWTSCKLVWQKSIKEFSVRFLWIASLTMRVKFVNNL